jgi:hypothetical protein
MSSDSSNDSQSSDRLSLNRITQELQTSLGERLGYPVIQFIVDDDYSGSGILVEVDGTFGILTAEHVVFQRIKNGNVLATIPAIYPIQRMGDTNVKADCGGPAR